ncbi:MAG: Fic family protein [Amylibacter sp.]|nr:Fic family protein [Amylibacter sp.]
MNTQNPDLSQATNYHYGAFPPENLDLERLLEPLLDAGDALARYDQMLLGMKNSAVLLAPLSRQEAVVSSRIEGTITTLDELLKAEADNEEDPEDGIPDVRSETLEVFLYQRAMRQAEVALQKGAPLSGHLLRQAHGTLLMFGRGQNKNPGEYKTEQNYLAERRKSVVRFIPISPEQLTPAMDDLFGYIDGNLHVPLLATAIAHLEFEALHPFNDGNGRIGRMLITLMLWNKRVLSAPHFYISAHLEDNRDEYIDRMRDVSGHGAWTEWCIFFMEALKAQAEENLRKTQEIQNLYEEMKTVLREITSSQWTVEILDFLFENPVFRNNKFTNKGGIPKETAKRCSKELLENDVIRLVEPGSGRRAALYAFEPLLSLVRG